MNLRSVIPWLGGYLLLVACLLYAWVRGIFRPRPKAPLHSGAVLQRRPREIWEVHATSDREAIDTFLRLIRTGAER